MRGEEDGNVANMVDHVEAEIEKEVEVVGVAKGVEMEAKGGEKENTAFPQANDRLHLHTRSRQYLMHFASLPFHLHHHGRRRHPLESRRRTSGSKSSRSHPHQRVWMNQTKKILRIPTINQIYQ